MATIFTKIIRGEIPCYFVAEDEEHFAFLDINPVAEGHTLVVPKLETDYLFDLNEQRLHGLISFSRQIARAIDRALSPLRTGIVVQGLEVPHAHIHLIPLYSHSQSMALGKKCDIDEQRMEEIAEKIKTEFRNPPGG